MRRWHRELAAPGLPNRARRALLAKWQRQGRACAYCINPPTTIDHVLPLVRGGTNYEGNLVPCCKTCNSSKAGLTIIEWRTGKRLPRMTSLPPWMVGLRQPKPKPLRIKAVQGVQVELFKVCTVCGLAYQGRSKAQCSKDCYEAYYRAERRQRQPVPRVPCMDCGQGSFPRTQRCPECHVIHKRIAKRATKARARARRRLAAA